MKKILALVISFALLLALLPAAFADTVPVKDGDVPHTDGGGTAQTDGGTVQTDGGTSHTDGGGTKTVLHDFYAGILSASDLNDNGIDIDIVGNNTIESGSDGSLLFGIVTLNDLNLAGDGSLTITSENKKNNDLVYLAAAKSDPNSKMAVGIGKNLQALAAECGGIAVKLPNGNEVTLSKDAVVGLQKEEAANGSKFIGMKATAISWQAINGTDVPSWRMSNKAVQPTDSNILSFSFKDNPAMNLGDLSSAKGVGFNAVIGAGDEEVHHCEGDVRVKITGLTLAGGKAENDLLHITPSGVPELADNWTYKNGTLTVTTRDVSPFLLVKKGSVQTQPPFTDVAEDGWAYTGVKYCWYYDLVNGAAADKFSPDAPLTRAQLWTILARMDGQTLTGDVLAAARAWAVGANITDGSNPGAAVTREDLALMLWRYAKESKLDVSAGKDANLLGYADAGEASEYAIPALQWACGAGVLNGSGGRLLPRQTASRAQAAAMIMRFCLSAAK